MPSLLVAHADSRVAGGPAELTKVERRELLRIAQIALGVATGSRPVPLLVAAVNRARRGHLGEVHGAVFVTLIRNDDLRGCMGALEPLRSLPQAVADASLLAARDDPRFWPVTTRELASLDIEISVLGPLVDARDPLRLRLGIDGVVVEAGGRRALLLPQVAPEQGWDALQLWQGVCRKAGLPDDMWRSPDAHLSIFQVVRFSGPAASPPVRPGGLMPAG